MPKLELHTSIEEVIQPNDIKTLIVKKINLGKRSYWTPFRTIYLSSEIPKFIREKALEYKNQQTLFEVNRIIHEKKQYESIKNAILENDDKKIRNILKIDRTIENQNPIISFSFSDFPTSEELIGKNVFYNFLDIVHEISSLSFVPHIRYGKSMKTAKKYDSRDFLKYVDQTVLSLSERNSKPIFVPLDPDYPKKIRDDILRHYAKKGYTNIWIDLKGKILGSLLIGKIRSIWRDANRLFGKRRKELVIYVTNPRKNSRQISKHGILPSDILATFSYSDFIGPPFKGIMGYTDDDEFWKRKGYSDKKEYEIASLRRDSSIFNTSSYYYNFPEEIEFKNRRLDDIRKNLIDQIYSLKTYSSKVSYLLNGFVTYDELNRIITVVRNEGKVEEYIEEKTYFKQEGKEIINNEKRNAKDLFDFDDI